MLYLMTRRKGYYVRVAIPRPLRSMFGNKSHVIYSLKTKLLPVAQERRWVEVAKIRAQFQAAREAKGNAEKFQLEKIRLEAIDWKKRIAAQGLRKNADEFQAAKTNVLKELGYEAMGEFVQISLGKQGTPLDHLEQEFYAARKITERTKIHYSHCRALLAEHLAREGLPLVLESVTRPVALSFERWLISQNTVTVTGNSYLGGLRSRFNYLISQMALPGPNPFTGISLKSSSTGRKASRREWYGPELEKLFADDPGQDLFNVMTVALLSGARRAEVLAFRARDFQDGHLEVTQGKSSAAIRFIPVSDVLKAGLKRLTAELRPDDLIFMRDDAEVSPHTRGNLCGQRFLRYRESLGLDDDATVFHSLRHTFMTLADESRPRHHVRVVVGHSDTKDVTSGYTRVSDANRLAVVQAVEQALPRSVVAVIKAKFGRA